MTKREEKLKQMVKTEREKVAGYEQVAKVHCAYIAILLKKLNATKDNGVVITDADIKEALAHYETRAMPAEDGWKLYYETDEE